VSDHDDAVPELSADAEAAWHAFAGSIAPDDGAQARVLRRMRARTRGTAERDEDDAPPLRRAAAAVLVMKSSAISVGLAGGALLSIKLIAAALRPSAPPPEPVAVVIPEPPAVERRTPADPLPRAATPPISAPTPVVETPSIGPVAQRPAPTSAPLASKADPLQAEVELLGRVRAALHAGENARALELIADHRTRFPAGSFVEEREAFAAIATCRQGDAKGPELARAFASARPQSVQLAAVRAACDAIANDPMDRATRQQ
jgi:hypothetical protein